MPIFWRSGPPVKKLLSFFLVLAMLCVGSSVCFARNVSTYDVLVNMDPLLLERFREGGLNDEMLRAFIDVLDAEADKLQKPEDRETLEGYFLSLLLLYVFQQERFLPVMVAFDQNFQNEVIAIGETGRVPESMEIFFLSVMGNNLAYQPPEPLEGGGGEAIEDPPAVVPTPTPTPTPVPTPTPPFSDLIGYDWAVPSVEYLHDLHLIQGYPDGTLRPDQPVSRAELTALVADALLDTTYFYSTSVYPDVREEDWFYRDLLSAEYFSLFQWIYDGDFLADTPVTRQELCAVVYRAYRRSGKELDRRVPRVDFLDFSQISSYAYDPIQLLQRAGCVSGYEDGCFCPRKIATRAETFQVIAHVLQLP